MTNDSTTLHIPISRSVRQRLDAKAKRLGFDSAQAYIRVWAQAEAEGRTLNFGDDWGQPTSEAATRLDHLAREARAESAAGKLPRFTDVDNMMKHLTSGKAD
jgi:hypothetical protein